MELGLGDRVAIVCAASQGLGKAAAAGFAHEGAHVVICSRDSRRLAAAAKEIQAVAARRARVLPVAADLTKPAHIKRLFRAVLRAFGRFGKPEELADVIVFLGSERASYISGTTVNVDGGLMKGII